MADGDTLEVHQEQVGGGIWALDFESSQLPAPNSRSFKQAYNCHQGKEIRRRKSIQCFLLYQSTRQIGQSPHKIILKRHSAFFFSSYFVSSCSCSCPCSSSCFRLCLCYPLLYSVRACMLHLLLLPTSIRNQHLMPARIAAHRYILDPQFFF